MKNKKIYKYFIIIALMLVIIMIFYKTNINTNTSNNIDKDDNLIGTWTTDGVTVYEFNGNGSGKMIVPSSEYKYTYIIHNNQIYIDFESDKATDSDYEYKIEEEKLILTGIKATTGTYTFTKQK